MSDWDREVKVASAWIADQVKAAIDRAFLPSQLWGGTGAMLKSDENMKHLRDFLEIEIDREFQVKKWVWDRSEPIRGSMLRVIGVDGRFPHEAILRAIHAIGADEAIDHLPHGMSVAINPGRLLVRDSLRENPIPIDVSTWRDPIEASRGGGG